MSLRRNIAANYASQLYVTAIGILIVPLYIRHMGAEAYGLVGFFAMLQAWFNLLDVGLSPTVARETARFRGGALTAPAYRQLVQALEGLFLAIALVGGVALFLSSEPIAVRWLQASTLSNDDVRQSLQFMALIVAMRWMCGLYRGEISGSERLGWLSGFNAAIATLRFVGVLPLLMLVSHRPTAFFAYQLAVAVIEILVLKWYAGHLLPAVPDGEVLPWAWAPLKPVLAFSMSVAFTSTVWVLVTQTDKLVLSKLLPLAEYGNFTLAVLVASGVTIVSGPVSAALMPRMARLEAQGDHAGLIDAYRRSTQLVAVLAGTAAVTAALFAEPLLWVWTGDRTLAAAAAPILALYALGNGILAVAAFPYYLQYAKGNLRLHLIGNAVFVVVLVPSIVWAASQHGSIGAGYAWLAVNVVSFFAWLPLVHHKFEPGLNGRWYGEDVLAILLPVCAAGYLANLLLPRADGRAAQFAWILAGGAITFAAGALASSAFRSHLKPRAVAAPGRESN